MAHVTGLGGIFYKVADTAVTKVWKQKGLGVGGEWGRCSRSREDLAGFALLTSFSPAPE